MKCDPLHNDFEELLLGVPCTLSCHELRETSRKNIQYLLCQHPEEIFPQLHKQLVGLLKTVETLTESKSSLSHMLWAFHIYLCMFSNTKSPLHPSTPTEKEFFQYIFMLYSRLQKSTPS